MTESRVEAVARAIDQSGCWETYDDLMRTGGYFPSNSLLDRLEKSKQRAQAAIEANDAWLLPDWVSEETRQEYHETIAGIARVRAKIQEPDQ